MDTKIRTELMQLEYVLVLTSSITTLYSDFTKNQSNIYANLTLSAARSIVVTAVYKLAKQQALIFLGFPSITI